MTDEPPAASERGPNGDHERLEIASDVAASEASSEPNASVEPSASVEDPPREAVDDAPAAPLSANPVPPPPVGLAVPPSDEVQFLIDRGFTRDYAILCVAFIKRNSMPVYKPGAMRRSGLSNMLLLFAVSQLVVKKRG